MKKKKKENLKSVQSLYFEKFMMDRSTSKIENNWTY